MSIKPIKLFSKFSVSRGSFWLAVGAAALMVGCAQTPPPSPTAAPDSSITPTMPSVATPAAPAPTVTVAPPAPKAMEVPSAASNAQPDPRVIATTSVLTPSGKTRYECVKGSNRTPIGLPEGSERVCSRFPAMGPCQYERDACRASGGRVIRFDGTDITKEVENEYDRQVQRFRLNAG